MTEDSSSQTPLGMRWAARSSLVPLIRPLGNSRSSLPSAPSLSRAGTPGQAALLSWDSQVEVEVEVVEGTAAGRRLTEAVAPTMTTMKVIRYR